MGEINFGIYKDQVVKLPLDVLKVVEKGPANSPPPEIERRGRRQRDDVFGLVGKLMNPSSHNPRTLILPRFWSINDAVVEQTIDQDG